MSYDYDDERTPNENIAIALFAIAESLRRVADGLHHSQTYSIAEAIVVSAKGMASAIESLKPDE